MIFSAQGRTSLPRFAFALGAIAVCAVLFLPVLYLGVRAGEATAASWDLILRPETLRLSARSLGLAAVVTLASVSVGLSAAWLVTRTDIPGRRIWSVLFAIPLVFPSYVAALAFISLLGPRGVLQETLEPLGVERLPDISGFFGSALVLTCVCFPYVYLVTAAGLRGLDPEMEEAARSLGKTRWETFRSVTLPLLRPSIAAGGLLVALYTLHDFGAVSLMRFQTFTQAIYLQYRGAFDRAPAAILSIILVAIALVIVAAEQRARGRASYFRTGTGTARPSPRVRLRSWKLPSLFFSSAVSLVAIGVPAAMLAYWAFSGTAATEDLDRLPAAALGSLSVSVAGALLALIAALPVAWFTGRASGRLSRNVARITYAGYALPGIVVALALVFFTANFVPGIYQSLPLVATAYVILFFPQVSEPLRAALLQMNPNAEHAARTLGAGQWRAFSRITLPRLASPALAGTALVFLTAMKELPATLLLRPTGFETLATRVWTASAAGLFSKAAIPALVLVVLSGAAVWAVSGRAPIEGVRPD
ncbi:MAG: iron ABC transporter permease [Actinomycetota bacterium]